MTSQRTSQPLWTDWTHAIHTAACGSSQLLVCMLLRESSILRRAKSIWAFSTADSDRGGGKSGSKTLEFALLNYGGHETFKCQ